MSVTLKNLPVPTFFDFKKVEIIWRVSYQARALDAQNWAKQYQIKPAAQDKTRICLVIIDVQNTFCLPDFELFVRGQSGRGAIDDNIRLCEFIYRNLNAITEITPTMDTHTVMQIFHSIFWINDLGEHPQPHSIINVEDIQEGRWKVNPAIAHNVANKKEDELQQYAIHYVRKLHDEGKYPLTIWPYHGLLGGIGHSLVSSIEEALFFHNLTRYSQTHFAIKGGNPLTENYSALRPEVLEDNQGRSIAQKNTRFIQRLLDFDAIIVAGQAKSHCVAWTIDDLLREILVQDANLAQKVYLLEDCTSPVVVPNIVDFTPQADAAFQRFADAGMHLVKSSLALTDFPALHIR